MPSRLFLNSTEFADNRIMIRRLYRVVHTTLVRRPMLRAHDVVDAHVEAVVMIRDARTVSRRYVAVGELRSQSAVSI